MFDFLVLERSIDDRRRKELRGNLIPQRLQQHFGNAVFARHCQSRHRRLCEQYGRLLDRQPLRC